MRRTILCLMTLIFACGDDAPMDGGPLPDAPSSDIPLADAGRDSGASDAGGDAGRDAPTALPVWPDAPSALALGEGERRRLRLPVGDGTVESDGVEASLSGDTLTIFAPYAPISGVAWSGEVRVRLSNAAGVTDYRIDVSVAPLKWGAPLAYEVLPDGPETREHPSLIVDEARGRMILIGGSGYRPQGTPLGDAWALDLETGAWSPLRVEGELSPGASRRVVHRPGETTAILFGGYAGGNVRLDELLRVDFSEETLRVEAIPQSGANNGNERSLHVFAYDPSTDTYWTYGGVVGTSPRGDVRRMQIVDGEAVWSFEETEGGPGARYGSFYGFDEDRGKLYVFSGASRAAPPLMPGRDVWALNVRTSPATWELIAEGESLPVGRRNGVFVWDPRGPRMWTFGGTPDGTNGPGDGLLVFDFGDAFSVRELALPNAPPIRSSGGGVYDAANQRILLGFGNSNGSFADVQTLRTTSEDVCGGLGSACESAATCAAAYCVVEERSMFGGESIANLPDGADTGIVRYVGGYCTPDDGSAATEALCDPDEVTDTTCGPCGQCIEHDDTTSCALRCDPRATDNGGCRDGYACSLEHEACVPGCSSDLECRVARVESNGIEGLQTPEDCAASPALCGDVMNYDGLEYSEDGGATCNTETWRCDFAGATGARAGDSCRRDSDCEANGECLDGLMCTRRGCAIDGIACGAGAICVSRFTGDSGLCLRECAIGTGEGVDPVDSSTWRVTEGGCPSDFYCHWDGETGGGCWPGSLNDVDTPNIGAPCASDAECWSPFGRGRCNPQWPGGYCTIEDCGAPGLPDGIAVGALCVPVENGSAARTLALARCASDMNCRPEYECRNAGGSRVCVPRRNE